MSGYTLALEGEDRWLDLKAENSVLVAPLLHTLNTTSEAIVPDWGLLSKCRWPNCSSVKGHLDAHNPILRVEFHRRTLDMLYIPPTFLVAVV